MRSIIRVSMLIGAVLIATAAIVAHKPEIAFAQPTPLCEICVDPSTKSIQDARDECDSLAQDFGYNIGILRPKLSTDTIVSAACPYACAEEIAWFCLGI